MRNPQRKEILKYIMKLLSLCIANKFTNNQALALYNIKNKDKQKCSKNNIVIISNRQFLTISFYSTHNVTVEVRLIK